METKLSFIKLFRNNSIGLKGKKPTQQATYCQKVVVKTTGNTFFPGSVPFLTPLNDAAVALQTAIDNPFGTAATVKEKKSALRKKMNAFIGNIQTVVDGVSDGLALEMLSTIDVEAKVVTAIHIDTLSAKQGREANSISVRRIADKKRVTYVFQICTDPSNEANWQIAKTSSKATAIIPDLESGKKYYLRVAIIRGDVQEDWSDQIHIIVD